MATNTYVNRETGAIAHVLKVDESFAYLSIESPAVGEQPAHASKYAMPIADYDAAFATFWRPATAEDLEGTPDPNVRQPRTITWAPEAPDDGTGQEDAETA